MAIKHSCEGKKNMYLIINNIKVLMDLKLLKMCLCCCIFLISDREQEAPTVGKKINWSPADFIHLPTDKEMISLKF